MNKNFIKKFLSALFCLMILVILSFAQSKVLSDKNKIDIATEILQTSNLEPTRLEDNIAKIYLSSKNLPKDFSEFKLENEEILFNIFGEEYVPTIEYYQFDKFEIKNKEILVTFI